MSDLEAWRYVPFFSIYEAASLIVNHAPDGTHPLAVQRMEIFVESAVLLDSCNEPSEKPPLWDLSAYLLSGTDIFSDSYPYEAQACRERIRIKRSNLVTHLKKKQMYPPFFFPDGKEQSEEINKPTPSPVEQCERVNSDDLLNAYLASLDCPQFLKDNIHDFTLLTLKAYEAAQCGIAERHGKSADLKGYLKNRLGITSEQSRVLYSLTKEPKKEP